MKTDRDRILDCLKEAQYSTFGLNRVTGIRFVFLDAELQKLVDQGIVEREGARFKLKEVANELPYEI